jgi:hypothetical protein
VKTALRREWHLPMIWDLSPPPCSQLSANALSAEQFEALAATSTAGGAPLSSCWLMRPPAGEAAALRRKHLDDLGRLTVESAMSEHRGKFLESDTKTHRARVVKVPNSVLEEPSALGRKRRRRSRDALVHDAGGDSRANLEFA